MHNSNVFGAVLAAALLIGAADAAVAGSETNAVPRVNVSIVSNKEGNTVNNSNNNVSVSQNTNKSAGASKTESSATNGNDGNVTAAATAAAAVSASVASGSSGGGSSSAAGDEAAASSAAPIFLSTGDDVCMGSGGVGVQSADVGLSLGSTWKDSNCVMLKNARELKNQGYDKAAKARLCMDDDNAMAFELAGEPCPRALASTQAAIARIREWNPEYMTAAAPGVQYAALGNEAGTAGHQAVALVGAPVARTDAAWLSSSIDSLLAVVKAVFERLASGMSSDAATGAPTFMDGIE